MKLFVIVTLLLVSINAYSKLTDQQVANLLKYNVVKIGTTFDDDRLSDDKKYNNGFGWIVGQDSTRLYIVTAAHVVNGEVDDIRISPNTIDVRLYDSPVESYSGKLSEASSFKDLDLAIISIALPNRQPWLFSSVSETSIEVSERVSFIGKGSQWYIPEQSGTVIGRIDDNDFSSRFDFKAQGLAAEEGTSGAPLISSQGIVGMIVTHSSEYSGIISLAEIKKFVLEESQLPWQLSAYKDPLDLSGTWAPKTPNIPKEIRLTFTPIDPVHFTYNLSIPNEGLNDDGIGVIDGKQVRVWQGLMGGQESYGYYQAYTEDDNDASKTEVLLLKGKVVHGRIQQASVRLAKLKNGSIDPKSTALLQANPSVIENFANELQNKAEENGLDENGIPIGLSDEDTQALNMGLEQGKVIPMIYGMLARNGIAGVNISIRSIDNDRVSGLRNKCYVAEGKVKSEKQYDVVTETLKLAVKHASESSTNRSNNMQFQVCNETYYGNPDAQSASFDFASELVQPQALIDTLMLGQVKLSVEKDCLLVKGKATNPMFKGMLKDAMKQLAKELSEKSQKDIGVCYRN